MPIIYQPLNTGLIHRAIAQSGGNLGPGFLCNCAPQEPQSFTRSLIITRKGWFYWASSSLKTIFLHFDFVEIILQLFHCTNHQLLRHECWLSAIKKLRKTIFSNVSLLIYEYAVIHLFILSYGMILTLMAAHFLGIMIFIAK